MKYVSLDVETTGLIRNPDNLLMISMVVEDTENQKELNDLPSFTVIIRRDKYEGQPYALGLNGWIFQMIGGLKESKYPIMMLEEMSVEATKFLDSHFGSERITLAGKNAGVFDYWFLPERLQKRFRHRIIDPGSVFIDWKKECIADLSQLKKHFSLDEYVSHDAYEDALDVIRVLRESYSKNNK